MPIHADGEIAANKPAIIIRDHMNQKCQIVDMAVPSDRNTLVEVVEKLIKYKDLEIEIARMWKQEQRRYQLSLVHLSTLTKSQAQSASMSSKKLLFWEQLTLLEIGRASCRERV